MNSTGSTFERELESLSEKRSSIANVLKSSSETFEKHFDSTSSKEYTQFDTNTFPDVRLDNLDNVLGRLRSAIKLTRPCVNEVSETISKLNALNSKVSSINEKIKNITLSKNFNYLCELERKINENYSKLKCVEKLQKYLNPPSISYVDLNTEEDDEKEVLKIIQSGEFLKKSRELCLSLKGFEEVSNYELVRQALERIDLNLELVSQMCCTWLTKHTKKISVLSSRVSSDSGIMNDPLINISDQDDKIGIISLFEINTNEERNHLRRNRDEQGSVSTLDEEKEKEKDKDEEGLQGTLSLRVLKILILSPENLAKFLKEVNEFMSDLSFRRFSSLLQYIKMDQNSKNNAIYDVFMNLQLVLSLIKSSVISLYHNCELDLYKTEHANLEICNAPNYIDKITATLVMPLESKLDQILNLGESTLKSRRSESINSLTSLNSDRQSATNASVFGENDPENEGNIISVKDILDLYTALQICHFYYKKIHNILKPPYLLPHLPSETQKNEGTQGDPEYLAENNPILLCFTTMADRWNELIATKLEQNITVVLSDPELSKKLETNQVIETISNFLSEIGSIQLEYLSSDDMLVILEMTLNPVINWCQKVSNEMGNKSHYFLVSAFATLLNSIQTPTVDETFKSLLEDLIKTSSESVSTEISSVVVGKLGGKVVNERDFEVQFAGEQFLEKLRNLVYTDSLPRFLPEDVSTSLSNLDSVNTKTVYRRVYQFMANVYKRYSSDSKKADELLLLASSYD